MKQSILVTGATGHFGKATIQFLLEKGVSANNISALVRSAEKAEAIKAKGIDIKVGDYDDYDSLVTAFNQVDHLLLVSSSDVVNRSKQQENAVKAAIEAGVKHILYTSFYSNNTTDTSAIAFVSKSHLDTEQLIIESGIPYTIFKNNLYFEVLPMLFGDKVFESGIFLPAGSTAAGFASRDDMAEVAANVLIESGHENKIYHLNNAVNTSIDDAAAILSAIAGKPITYTSPSSEVYFETLQAAGVPNEYIGFFASFAEAIKAGEFKADHTDLPKLLQRTPTTLNSFLFNFYQK